MTSPPKVVKRIATMICTERTASHSIASMVTTIVPATSQALSSSDENSSSDKGAEPVRRTRAPCTASIESAFASARIASLAAAPGSSAE